MPEDLIPLKLAAERFDANYDTLRRAAYDGRLKAERHGNQYKVRPSEVQRFLTEGGRAPSFQPTGAAPARGLDRCRVLAVAITKGGVGKSTTTLNLGAALAERGLRVLAVDCDHQCSLTLMAGVNIQGVHHSLYTAMMDYLTTFQPILEPAIEPTAIGFDLVPASVRLTRADKELNLAPQREFVLQKLLAPVLPRYDVVLLDTEPTTNNLVTNALVAAHEVLLPLEAEPVALESLAVTLEDIAQIQRSGLNPTLTIRGVLLNKVDERLNVHRQAIEYTRTEVGANVPIFQTMIKRSTRFPESQGLNQSILRYDPHSDGANAYRRLAEEVIRGWQ
ncbi:MAG TPA: AAA family ATPase [Herpetosiphonaceae bacterium]